MRKVRKSAKLSRQRITVSVIGGHDADENVEQNAHNIGKIIAKMGAIVVCGGLLGVMEAVCRGSKEAGGLTIGLLPGKDKNDANCFVDIALPTSIGYARNVIVACSADIIIALPGSHGTRSEISYGLVYKRPVIDFGNWDIDGMIKVDSIPQLELVLKKLIEEIEAKKSA